MPYYTVKEGREKGVFTSWENVKRSVDKYPGAKYKKFDTQNEAYEYLNQENQGSPVRNRRFLDHDVAAPHLTSPFHSYLNGEKSFHNKYHSKEEKYKKNPLGFYDLPKEVKEKGLKVFTDGSCLNNENKKKRYGGYAVYFNDESSMNHISYIKRDPTNQKAELCAIKKALEITKECKEPIIIFTDSDYAINCITNWYTNWEKNGFKTKKGGNVKHLEIIKGIRNYYKRGNIYFIHVNSHTPEPEEKETEEYFIWYGNYKADYFANLGAKKAEEIQENLK